MLHLMVVMGSRGCHGDRNPLMRPSLLNVNTLHYRSNHCQACNAWTNLDGKNTVRQPEEDIAVTLYPENCPSP